jgi:hypothetical protein
MGVGSASVMFFRQIGGSIGTAVFLTLMFSAVPGAIADQFQTAAQTPEFQQTIQDPDVLANPVNAAVVEVIKTGSLDGASDAGVSLDDTSFINELDPVLAAPFQEGFADAITGVIFISSLITIIAFVLSFFVPQVPLREKSGLETMREDGHEITMADKNGNGIPDADEVADSDEERAPVGEPGF